MKEREILYLIPAPVSCFVDVRMLVISRCEPFFQFPRKCCVDDHILWQIFKIFEATFPRAIHLPFPYYEVSHAL
jgi:hypothetical protein